MTAAPGDAATQGPGPPPDPEQQTRPLVEETGTTWDEFLPIYAALAIPGVLRRGYTVPEVDAMEIPVVGALLRAGPRPLTAEEEAAEMLRKRVEAERLGLPPPEW